jgi:type I restriction enzyme R subunit
VYCFIIQATAYENISLHKRYNYLSYLIKEIDVSGGGNDFDIADKITVSSFVQKQTSVNKVAEIEAKYEVKIQKPKPAMPEVEQLKMLSVIIEEINAQYGVNYEKDVATKSALQIRDLLLKDERLKASAKSNSLADFRFAYEDSVSDALVNGYEQNVDFYTLLLGNAEIRERITNVFMEEIYRILRGEK